MSRARRSLRDRDEFAIAGDPEPAQAPTEEPAAPAPEPAPSASAPPPKANASKPQPRQHSAATQRIGIYFRPGQFEAAKAGYLADWSHLPDSPDTFALWIAGAVERHSALTPMKRAEVATALFSTEAGERGLTRSFNLPETTVAAMKTAIGDDRAAGQWGSQSEFCGVAIAAATDAARERAGGNLPPAPDRLPNRLIR